MTSDHKREEDREKLKDQDEEVDRLREDARRDSKPAAAEKEMGREVREKGPAEAMKDDMKATKEQVKEWAERDEADSSQNKGS